LDKGRISKLPLEKGNKPKEESWEAYQGRIWCVFFRECKETKEEKECVREDISSYV
jgi:hypothetical protein